MATLGVVLGLIAPALCAARAGAGGSLFTIELSGGGEHARVVVGLPRPLAFTAAVDAPGSRVVIDFDGIAATPSGTIGRGQGLVRSHRTEKLPGGGVRLILNLARAAVITAVRTAPAEPGRPARAVIDLGAVDARVMGAASGVVHRPQAPVPSPRIQPNRQAAAGSIGALIAKTGVDKSGGAKSGHSFPAPPPATTPTPIVEAAIAPLGGSKAVRAKSPRRTIVIDAGHGGIDPGAQSVAGYHEKEITLAAARALKRTLEQTGRYAVVLTRDSDVYLKLRERVARARAAHGALFISLHADSVAGGSSARGASVYTLSETASDSESERLAQRENRADAIGGVDLGRQSDDVAGILVDLTVRRTVNDGNRLAGMMVDCLRQQGIGLLPVEPHRSAGFAVLKSPDIPSVLIEMGYLSDLSDSRGLADPRHQLQIARAITAGVDRYFDWLQTARS